MIEYQADHVLRQIQRIAREGLAWIDVKPAAMAAYNDEIQREIAAIELWQAGCTDYYRAPSGRIVTQWPRSMPALRAGALGPRRGGLRGGRAARRLGKHGSRNPRALLQTGAGRGHNRGPGSWRPPHDGSGRRGHRSRVGDGAGDRPAPGGARRPRRPARPRRAKPRSGRRGPARDGRHRDRRGGRRHRPRRRRRGPRQGARGARTDRDHGHQRRPRRVRVLHGHHDRELGAHPRRQPDRDVPLPAGRRSRHARGALGPDGHDLVVERAVGCPAHGALRRVEGRRDRADQGARARARAARDHGQQHPAGRDRHADVAPRRGRRRPRRRSRRSPPG